MTTVAIKHQRIRHIGRHTALRDRTEAIEDYLAGQPTLYDLNRTIAQMLSTTRRWEDEHCAYRNPPCEGQKRGLRCLNEKTHGPFCTLHREEISHE